MISICHKTYDINPKVYDCGYEGIEIFVHGNDIECWKNQTFYLQSPRIHSLL